MIEYDVVCESNFRKFKEAVNEKLREGWKLQGGLCTMNMVPFYQAIYREVEDEPQS